MSMMARSGRCWRTSSSSSCASRAWPMTSNPAPSSRLATPSRSRTSSSAKTMRLRDSPTMSRLPCVFPRVFFGPRYRPVSAPQRAGRGVAIMRHCRNKENPARRAVAASALVSIVTAAGKRGGAASAGVAASIGLVLLSVAYLNRSVVRPVRRASEMADRVAGGNLTVRVPETGPGEVGGLQRSFNRMADSLEASQKELRQAADELTASRARVIAAADETRRRIERDLHEGTQQRLITLALQLRTAQASVPPEHRNLVEQWSRTSEGLTEVIDELREISRGLHPAILDRGGLGPALRVLARRAPIPVEVNVRVRGRLPEQVEAAVYYVVSEALTNAAKHARASVAQVDVDVDDDVVVRLLVRDDGVGGADSSGGSGLIGLADRVEAAGGRLVITSPPGGGTTLAATIPVRAGGSSGIRFP